MTYEELIKELCDVIKESETNSVLIYDSLDEINERIQNLEIPIHEKNRIQESILISQGLLQHQDLHRQKIERVVNFVSEKNNIDISGLNIANSAKCISSSDSKDFVLEEELEALIKSMTK